MIYIIGDTHIPTDISKLNTKNFPRQKNMTKDDFVIICGDFGGVWDGSREEAYWRKWLDDKNFTTLFVDGNHENFNLLSMFEEIDLFGGKARKISDSIYHLMRGYVYEIEGMKIFTFGGASSHDIQFRTDGKNWWAEELPSEDEMKTAYENLSHHDWNVEYVITHCAPTSVINSISEEYEKDVLTDFFDIIKEKLTFEKWYFGHYHKDMILDEKFNAVFENIILIG